MKGHKYILLSLITLVFAFINTSSAQNPFIRDQYSADPSARVFGERVFE